MNLSLVFPQHAHIRRGRQRLPQRRGATLVLSAFMMFVLFGFLAFSVDTGYLAQSRAEIRRTADAAAMAGCWELFTQMQGGGGMDSPDSQQAVRTAAAGMAAMNQVCRAGPVLDTTAQTEDIKFGYLANNRDSALSNDSSLPFFGVQANVSRTQSKNGEIPYFFGKIFGDQGRPMSASATAVMAQKISGFSLPPSSSHKLNLLPFALDIDTWEAMLAGNAPDNYAYDPTHVPTASSGSVSGGSDGIREVNLFPQNTGSPGNRGTVDIGGANNSTNDIARQIVHGISEQDLVDLGKPLVFNAQGTMTLNGDTGISAGVKDELASIIGQTRVIPIFSSVSGNGNNANYTIVRWVGVRILDVKLTGKMSGKYLMVQPAPVIETYGVVATGGDDTSDFVLSPVTLAR
ncbi:MAG: hypothetical protein KDA45_14335 [Planctomycetales bacterium]|nr:hypothetical protein [Planctomycetales bacterium]